jgi:hypothetical protein
MNLKNLSFVLLVGALVGACSDGESGERPNDIPRGDLPRTDPPEDDHGDTAARASDVSEATPEAGTIAGGNDVDWFRFVPTTASLYQISTSGALDTQCTLYDVTLRRLAHDDDSGVSGGCKIEQALDAESTYFVRVAPQVSGAEGDYTLTIVALDTPVDPEPTIAPRIALAPAIVTAGQSLQVTGEQFTVSSRVTFEVSGPEHLTVPASDTDADGNVAIMVEVPEAQVGGRYELRAVDVATGLDSVWVSFTVNAVEVIPANEAVDAGNGGNFEGNFAAPGSPDRYRFTANRTGLWRLYTEGGTDVVCVLMDNDENEVASNDDGGEGLNCLIEHQITAGTPWIVQVAPYDAETEGPYTLVIEPPSEIVNPDPDPEPQADDHGNDPAHATLLLPILPRSGYVGKGDVDVFQFIAFGTGVYTFTTIGFIDTHCSLLENNGDVIVQDDNSGILLNCMIQRRLNSGDVVFIAVRHGHPNGEGEYTLIGTPPEEDDHGDTIDTASPVIEGAHEAQMSAGGDLDVFSFVAEADATYTFATTGNLDLVCRLLDENGDLLAETDDEGNALNCLTAHEMALGDTVHFEVRGYNENIEGAYNVTIATD